MAYSVVKDVISNLETDGNGEKFYPSFYECVFSRFTVMFPSFGRDASLSIGLELADHILAFLSAGYIADMELKNSVDIDFDLSPKEKRYCDVSRWLFF